MILVKSNCPRFTVNKRKAQVEGPGLLEDERTFSQDGLTQDKRFGEFFLKDPISQFLHKYMLAVSSFFYPHILLVVGLDIIFKQ